MADDAPKDTALQSTKQMLDELDALMERMLSLPVNELDDQLTYPKETSKGPSLAASLTLLGPATPAATSGSADTTNETSTAKTAPPPKKSPIERRPKAKGGHPPTRPPHLKRAPFPAPSQETVESMTAAEAPAEMRAEADELLAMPMTLPEPVPLTNEVLPPTVLPELEPLLAQMPEQVPTSVGGMLTAPLWWVNQAFDRSTMSMGGLGHWLRGPNGRGLLGFSGMVLALLAVVWVVKDWLGWNW
jgi:hypothetical protein